MRARYDALVVEIARQEKRLKQRIGSLDRSKRAAEQRYELGERTRLKQRLCSWACVCVHVCVRERARARVCVCVV